MDREHGSAPVKCAAHRNVKPLGRTSNMALRQPSLKDHQQLEAGVPKISKIPLVSPFPEIAKANGLLSYGPDSSLSRRSASLVDQIPKGSKTWRSQSAEPSDVELSANFHPYCAALPICVERSLASSAHGNCRYCRSP
jgi:hypothetical protein